MRTFRRPVLVCCALLLLSPFLLAADAPGGGTGRKAEHVVLVVWDGMRPDLISPEQTPTLAALAAGGVFFKNHHSVYISSTEVNGTALATGVYPNRSGIIANRDYRPQLLWQDSLGTETVEAIRRGDLFTGNRFIAVPTVAEILHRAGYRTVVAGTKPVALLHDRFNRRTIKAARESVVLYNGLTIPSSVLPSIIEANEKAWPGTNTTPNTARDSWTTTGLTRVLWKNGVPKYTLLWLSEPDASQHSTSPGSATSKAALQTSDRHLAILLNTLAEKKVLAKTDLFVVSDHGFSTIERVIDLPAVLTKAQFKAAKKLDDPEPGDVLVVGLGGSFLLYVIDHDEAVTRRLVDYFQGSDFAGVIFSRRALEGTFPLDQVRLNTTSTAPDLVISMRWRDATNQYAVPGLVLSEGGKKSEGTHASLSPFDMSATLVAWGPDFRQGYVNEYPTANVDVAPTILWLLGIRPASPLDGRVLREALRGPGMSLPQPEEKTITASRDLPDGRWEQYLKFRKLSGHIYFYEGNGRLVPK